MDSLLAPLEELQQTSDVSIKGSSPSEVDTKIPIPDPSYLLKTPKPRTGLQREQEQPLRKYEKEYEAFCEWSALPKELRKPKTATEFERKHLLPRGYTYYFKTREDFRDKSINYFWEWLMDLYPDVVHAIYKRAIGKSDKAAGIFMDLIAKKMNLDKPKVTVQPMVLMGVAQEKIDQLFVPKEYEKVLDATPEKK